MKWKKIRGKEILKNDHIRIRRDSVKLPGGLVIKDYYLTEMKSVALVVPVLNDKSVLMVEQYRYGPDKVLFEFPAGTFWPNKDNPLKVAKKELEEEAGYKAGRYIFLGEFYEYPTKDTHSIYLYLATNLRRVATGHKQEETEQISLHKFTFSEVMRLIEKNRIQVLGSVTAFLLTMRALKRRR